MRARVLFSVLLGLALSPAEAAERVVLPTVDIPPMGGRETWPIAHSQVRRHRIELQAGEFLRATLVQEGANVLVRTVSAAGVPRDVDLSESGRGREPASLLADLPGTYAFEVELPEDGRGPGFYSVAFEAVRPATALDREWMVAEWALGAGGVTMGPRAADTRRGMPHYRTNPMNAAVWFREAQQIIDTRPETCWRAEVWTHLALMRTWAQEMRAGSDEFFRLLDLWQECGDEWKFTETLLYTGRWYHVTGRYEEAASVFDLGLRLVRERDDDFYLALQFLVALGTTRGMLGETRESIALHEEALPLLRRIGHRQGESVVLEGLANSYHRRGDLQRAAELALAAASLKLAIDDRANAATTLTKVAQIHDALGDPEAALRYYDQAAAIMSEFDEGLRVSSAVVLAASAGVLVQLGRRREAVERLLDLIHRFERNPEVPSLLASEVPTRSALARLYADESSWDDALPHVERAVARVERAGDRHTKAALLELRGRIGLGRDDRSAARADLEASLELRRAIGDRVGEVASHYQLSRLHVAEGDRAAARARLEDARRVAKDQRTLIVSPALRATWAATVRNVDEAYVDLLSSEPGRQDDVAFDASEGAHARTLLEMLGESRLPLGEGADAALVERERELRARLTERLDRQMRASEDANASLASEIRELESEHHRARAAVRAAHPRYGAFADPEPLRLAGVQRELLDQDTTLVEYFLGRDRSHAWVVTRDSLRSYELPPRARIDQAVAELRQPLEHRSASARQAERSLRALAKLVVDPLAGDLRGRRLVVVPDGSLHRVPFAALTDGTGVALLARYEVVNAPSASVVALQRKELRDRPRAPRAVAVLADPVYDGRDERLGTGRAPAAHGREARLERVTRAFGFRDGRLPRLPFTRREARGILDVAPSGSSRLALDFGASLAAVRDPELGSYRYLHFATHGLLNDALPELSGIVLSLVDASGREQAGLLTAPEVMDLDLAADLVVLSSCRSALGREVSGEGLLGLTRAFMHAGAPRVVASLWPVDDLATSELMKRFYRGMLGPDHLPPAAALRRAQQELRRQPQWRSPYYWAGFQLLGDWN